MSGGEKNAAAIALDLAPPPSDLNALQAHLHARNAHRFVCFGVHLWKRQYARHYLYSPGHRVHFFRHVTRRAKRLVEDGTVVLTWGVKEREGLDALLERTGAPVYRMEDGFLRSIGLGSDMTAPASLVVDSRGIYYDPRTPSDLEHLLQNADFTDEEIARASALRRLIVELKISKYNVDGGDRVQVPTGRDRVILVPGQVEDDASIQLGCVDVRTNAALLAAAREANPDAYIIFKPHPDVVSGNRQGHVPKDAAARLADAVIEDGSISQCLDMATDVHTMTSLVGFEGLLRGLNVTVYGRPFYSGWGLTRDRHQVARRTRTRTLDELVAGTLLRYPRYIDPETFRCTTPENIVLRLQREREAQGPLKTKRWRPARQLRRLAKVIEALLHAR